MNEQKEGNDTTSRWNPWPASIIGFFVVALLGCGTLVAFCSRHPADLVAADYYEQEVEYQGQMERVQHAQREAQGASVTYEPGSKRITIQLPPNVREKAVVGNVQLYRPSSVALDRQLKLEPDGNGVQRIDAGTLARGLWRVRVTWTQGQEECFIEEKVVIDGKETERSYAQ